MTWGSHSHGRATFSRTTSTCLNLMGCRACSFMISIQRGEGTYIRHGALQRYDGQTRYSLSVSYRAKPLFLCCAVRVQLYGLQLALVLSGLSSELYFCRNITYDHLPTLQAFVGLFVRVEGLVLWILCRFLGLGVEAREMASISPMSQLNVC